MKIIKSKLFEKFPRIKFGFSTKIGLNRKPPYYFNMSKSVNDDPLIVDENRKAFFNEIGINSSSVVFQKQVHGDIVRIVDKPGQYAQSDAMITNKTGLGLAISTADCTPIFVYDKSNKVIAGVHSGWRSTKEKILTKTLIIMNERFKSKPQNLFAYIGPVISQKNYEVGREFEKYFSSRYLVSISEKFLLDLKQANYDMLIDFGIPQQQIEVSNLCTFEEEYLFSYRRDGKISGRALGVIGL